MSLLRGEKPKLPGEEEGVSPLCGAGEVMALEQWMAITQYEDSGTVDWIEHQDPASTWLLSFYVEVLTSEIANLYPYQVLQSLRARSTRVLSHTAPPHHAPALRKVTESRVLESCLYWLLETQIRRGDGTGNLVLPHSEKQKVRCPLKARMNYRIHSLKK